MCIMTSQPTIAQKKANSTEQMHIVHHSADRFSERKNEEEGDQDVRQQSDDANGHRLITQRLSLGLRGCD